MTPRLACGGLLMLLSTTAAAHSPIEGIDDLYAGVLHPWFVPAHLLGVLALGLLLGQLGVMRMRFAVIAYYLAVAAGLAAVGSGLTTDVELVLLGAAALTGALVALNRELPAVVYAGLSASLGGLVGLDSAQDALSGGALVAALLGTAVGAALLLMYAAAFAEWFSRHHWQRIGLRVAGSWAAASAVLVLSVSFAR